MYHSQPIRSS